MKTQKKVAISAGLTEKSRNAKAEKAKEKWEKQGWTVVNRIDGGMSKSSFLELEKEEYATPTSTNKSKGKTIGIILAVIFVIGLFVGENEDKNQKLNAEITGSTRELSKIDITSIKQKANNGDKELQFELGAAYYTGEGVEQDKLNNITQRYMEVRWAVIDVLSAIYSDTNKVEKRFNSFLNAFNDNDTTHVQAIREAQNNNNERIRELTYKSYTPSVGKGYKDISDKKAIKDLEDLIKYSQNTNLFLQLSYDSFLEWVDNQKPTLLAKFQENLETYQSGKLLVVFKLFELGEKYSLAV